MPETIENNIGMKLIFISAGTFTMGGDTVAEQADENETPRHEVIFERPFYMGKYPVTQDQWRELMKSNPSQFKGGDLPVETVSHSDAVEFVRRMNLLQPGEKYQLPTEAQWEYAARAGSQSAYCFGPERMRLGEYAWYKANSESKTHSVGQLKPNSWGFYDMHGNVHEWCADWFDRNYYVSRSVKDPKGPTTGLAKVLRGGDWGSEDWYCRCAIRSLSSPDRKSPRVGFRVSMTLAV